MRFANFSPKRFLPLTIIAGSLHCILIGALSCLGFFTAIQGVGPGHPNAARDAATQWDFAALLDFPITKISLNSEAFFPAQFLWSLCVGLMIVPRRQKRR